MFVYFQRDRVNKYEVQLFFLGLDQSLWVDNGLVLPAIVRATMSKDVYAIRMLRYVKSGRFERARSMIEKGANIHAHYDCALRTSAQNGQLDMVKYLLEKGANIHVNGDDALKSSAKNGHLEVLKLLISKGAHFQDNANYMLQWSAWNSHLNVVKFLVHKGVNIRADDDALLRLSAKYGRLEIVKYLMYEVAFGQTRDFGFKYHLIKNSQCAHCFRTEYIRRATIISSIKQLLYCHALQHHLRPTSLRVHYMSVHFNKHFTDRQYWD